MKKKKLKIVAGPNGSGKTTFAETFISKSDLPFLNPDLIAAGLGPADFEKASFQAGRILLTEIKEKIMKGESFSFESTLSGLTYASILKAAKNQGYEISIYYIFLNKINLNISRIKKRVSLGGHFIPTYVLKRRQIRCFENFWKLYKDLADNWIILDNSSNKPKMVLSKKDFNKLSTKEKSLFIDKFLRGQT